MSFFFNDTATTEIYTLSLHDALPIFGPCARRGREVRLQGGALARVQGRTEVGIRGQRPAPGVPGAGSERGERGDDEDVADRKSTRLNSSHANISYAVFCLKKKKR